MTAKPIVFGNFQFRTKEGAKKEARRRIDQYEENQKLYEDDELFFSSLFTLHSEYQEKIGTGIEYITVQKDFHHNRCLYIHRTDGSKVDCSWVHCLQPASLKQIVSVAFRRAVKERVMEFKNDQLSKVKICPILGIQLTYNNSHACYSEKSFDKMLSDFLSENGLTIESIKLTNPSSEDIDQRGILTDSSLVILWNKFHADNARLKLISKKANSSKPCS